MDIDKIQELSDKLEIMLRAEKQLVKEVAKSNENCLDIKVELDKINKQINDITYKLDKLMNSRKIEVIGGTIKRSFKDYSDKEIYEIRQTNSIRKTANFLNCSVSTVRRICKRYEDSLCIMDDDKFNNDYYVDF